jgi:hypothetical protein
MKSAALFKPLAGALCLALLLILCGSAASAKSVYVIANINQSPTPIRTYDIQGAPQYLVFQATQNVPSFAGGAVGLGLDATSRKLFVTYEVSNVIQLLDATSFANLGTTSAPGASNLAGIVVDEARRQHAASHQRQHRGSIASGHDLRCSHGWRRLRRRQPDCHVE